MTIITKGANIYLADTHAPIRYSGISGAALDAGAPCYLNSDGRIYMSGSALVDDTGHPNFVGFTVQSVSASAPCTLFGLGSRIHIAESGLTIGARVWSGSVVGTIQDAKGATNDVPYAKVVSATDILVVRGPY